MIQGEFIERIHRYAEQADNHQIVLKTEEESHVAMDLALISRSRL